MKRVGNGKVVGGIGGKGCFWPSVARLADGRLAVAYSGDRLNHICPFGRVEISYSSDEGEHWSPGAVVLDTPLDDRDAGIIRWKDKAVLTTFNNTAAFQRECLGKWQGAWTEGERAFLNAYLNSLPADAEEKYLGSLIAVSDDGEHFDSFVKVPVSAPHGPVVLADGSLLYIGKAFSGGQTWTDTPLGGGLYAIRSEDGKNWTAPLPLPGYDLPLFEPSAAEIGEGHVLAAARAHGKNGELTIVLSDSFDGGRTFSPFRPTGFCGAPPHLLARGKEVILTYGRREPPFGIRARVSRDGGQSWSEELALREDGTDWDLGYPCSAFLKDGSILTVYYMKAPGKKLPEIQYTVWTAEKE